MFDRIKSWLFREDCKLTSGTALEGGWYIWTYYRYWIMGIAAALGVLVMEKEDIESVGRVGRLLELEDGRLSGLDQRWTDRLVWVAPNEESRYEKSVVAVGIDLSGSCRRRSVRTGVGASETTTSPSRYSTRY